MSFGSASNAMLISYYMFLVYTKILDYLSNEAKMRGEGSNNNRIRIFRFFSLTGAGIWLAKISRKISAQSSQPFWRIRGKKVRV